MHTSFLVFIFNHYLSKEEHSTRTHTRFGAVDYYTHAMMSTTTTTSTLTSSSATTSTGMNQLLLLQPLLVILVLLVANPAHGEAYEDNDGAFADSKLYSAPPTTPKTIVITLLLIPIVSLLVWIFHNNKNSVVLFYNNNMKQSSGGNNSGNSSCIKADGFVGEEKFDTETETVKNGNGERAEEYYGDDDERKEEDNAQEDNEDGGADDEQEFSFQEYGTLRCVVPAFFGQCNVLCFSSRLVALRCDLGCFVLYWSPTNDLVSHGAN